MCDPDFYDKLYVAGNTRRTEIWPRYRKGIGFDGDHPGRVLLTSVKCTDRLQVLIP